MCNQEAIKINGNDDSRYGTNKIYGEDNKTAESLQCVFPRQKSYRSNRLAKSLKLFFHSTPLTIQTTDDTNK
jgi:hypothetical protein